MSSGTSATATAVKFRTQGFGRVLAGQEDRFGPFIQDAIGGSCKTVGSGDHLVPWPDQRAVLRLIGTLLAEQQDEWKVGRHCFSQASMAVLDEDQERGRRCPLLGLHRAFPSDFIEARQLLVLQTTRWTPLAAPRRWLDREGPLRAQISILA